MWRERGGILILGEMFRNEVQERNVEIINHISKLSKSRNNFVKLDAKRKKN
jgi:hypothetical protein